MIVKKTIFQVCVFFRRFNLNDFRTDSLTIVLKRTWSCHSNCYIFMRITRDLHYIKLIITKRIKGLSVLSVTWIVTYNCISPVQHRSSNNQIAVGTMVFPMRRTDTRLFNLCLDNPNTEDWNNECELEFLYLMTIQVIFQHN